MNTNNVSNFVTETINHSAGCQGCPLAVVKQNSSCSNALNCHFLSFVLPTSHLHLLANEKIASCHIARTGFEMVDGLQVQLSSKKIARTLAKIGPITIALRTPLQDSNMRTNTFGSCPENAGTGPNHLRRIRLQIRMGNDTQQFRPGFLFVVCCFRSESVFIKMTIQKCTHERTIQPNPIGCRVPNRVHAIRCHATRMQMPTRWGH